jgi:cell division protein FtsW (lipid II flippase)
MHLQRATVFLSGFQGKYSSSFQAQNRMDSMTRSKLFGADPNPIQKSEAILESLGEDS